MKQLNFSNSPFKRINLNKVAKFESGIRKVDLKEKSNKLQLIFRNVAGNPGIKSETFSYSINKKAELQI